MYCYKDKYQFGTAGDVLKLTFSGIIGTTNLHILF